MSQQKSVSTFHIVKYNLYTSLFIHKFVFVSYLVSTFTFYYVRFIFHIFQIPYFHAMIPSLIKEVRLWLLSKFESVKIY